MSTGAGFNRYGGTERDEFLDGFRGCRNARFTRLAFFEDCDADGSAGSAGRGGVHWGGQDEISLTTTMVMIARMGTATLTRPMKEL